jgi:hypothetical protein
VRVGNVGHLGVELVAVLLAELFERRLAAGDTDDVGTGVEELAGDRPAETAARPGDDP